MAAFTQLALSTNCYKLTSLLKSIQHAFMLCYHLVAISNPCKRYKFSWNHLVVCKLPNPIDESKELPSIEVVQGRGCDICELSYTSSSSFFHRACSSMNWSWNLLSTFLNLFIPLLWNWRPFFSPCKVSNELKLGDTINQSLSVRVVVVKPNMATVCGTFVQVLAPPRPNLWDQTTL